MFPKITKNTKRKTSGWKATKNHQKYFTSNTCISRWWSLLSIFLVFIGAYLLYLSLPKKFHFELMQVSGLILICGALVLLIFLALQQKKNLKGIMLDVETDLMPDVHYVVESIIIGSSPVETLCRLSIKYPALKTLSPWTGAWKIEQMAREQGINFAPGLVFGIRKDGTFFFVHPPNDSKQKKEKVAT